MEGIWCIREFDWAS